MKKHRKKKVSPDYLKTMEILPAGVYEVAFDHHDEAGRDGIMQRVEIAGQWLRPQGDDRLLPPLLVGIYGNSGKLIDVQSIPDPRAKYCHQIRNAGDVYTGKLIALPLVVDDSDTRYLLDERRFVAAE